MSEKKILCIHIREINKIMTSGKLECEECVKIGGKWVHLRVCQSCGATMCCDSSEYKHMSTHALSMSHPVASSAEPGENWMWCYKDQQGVNFD